jgi:hypothetical protein
MGGSWRATASTTASWGDSLRSAVELAGADRELVTLVKSRAPGESTSHSVWTGGRLTQLFRLRRSGSGALRYSST